MRLITIYTKNKERIEEYLGKARRKITYRIRICYQVIANQTQNQREVL